jgi:hypothetical protein
MKLQIRDWSAPVVEYSGQPVYIRYGLWGRRSLNFGIGQNERGVSVYRGKIIDGAAVLDDYPDSRYLDELRGRFVFAVTGDMIDEGSDYEPVIKAVKILNIPIHLTVSFRHPAQ